MTRHRDRRSWPVAVLRAAGAVALALTLAMVGEGTALAPIPPAPPSYTVPIAQARPGAPVHTCTSARFCLPDRKGRTAGASANGWPADPELEARTVPGTRAVLTVREGPAGDLLVAVALRYDRTVEGLDGPVVDDWGANDRKVRGEAHLVSDHASGTAVDLNSVCHGLSVPVGSTFTAAELAAVQGLVDSTRGVVEWGGDYSRPDGMHWGLAPGTTDAQAAAAVAALGGVAPASVTALPSRSGCSAPG